MNTPTLNPHWRGQWIAAAFSWVIAVSVGLASLAVCHGIAGARVQSLEHIPINGDFQSFNPVRRLHLGQRPGRDFDAYLGIGPTYLTYFATLATGPDFRGCVYATFLVSSALHFATMVFLCRLARLPVVTSALIGGILLLVPLVELPSGLATAAGPFHEWFLELGLPSNSCLGLRTAGVLVAALPVAVGLRLGVFDRLSTISALTGLAFLGGGTAIWSNDCGPTALLSLTLMVALGTPTLFPKVTIRGRRLLMPAAFLLGSLSAGLLLLSLATGGDPVSWFNYNYRGVAADQFWYFLAFERVLDLRDIPVYPLAVVGALCSACLVVRLLTRRGHRSDLLFVYLLCATLASGLLCSMNKSERYFFPLYRCLVVALPYCFLSVFADLRAWRGSQDGPDRRRFWTIPRKVVLPVLLTVFCLLGWRHLSEIADGRWRMNAAPLDVPELGGQVPVEFDKPIAIGRQLREEMDREQVPADRRIFSTYTSLIDVVAAAVNPTPDDYIIHALGEARRRQYAETLVAVLPLYACTLREEFTVYERWLRRVNWNFYRELFRRYDPIERTLYGVLWKRRAHEIERIAAPVECSVRRLSPGVVELSVALPEGSLPAAVYYVDVRIEYRATRSESRIRTLNLRQYLHAECIPDKWGLSPSADRAEFPVELAPGQSRTIVLSLLPQAVSKLDVGTCTATVVRRKAEIDAFPLSVLRAAGDTDSGTIKGIVHSGNRAGFVVQDPTDLRDLEAGDQLKFMASEVRTITRISGRTVFLDGGALDPQGDGFPNRIEVVNPRAPRLDAPRADRLHSSAWTDGNLRNGIARARFMTSAYRLPLRNYVTFGESHEGPKSGFLAVDGPALRRLQPGTRLTFEKSGLRTVESVAGLFITLEGDQPLDPDRDGAPFEIRIAGEQEKRR